MRLNLWLEALASCAIEGNRFAIEMLDLWRSGRRSERLEFVKRLVELDESNKD